MDKIFLLCAIAMLFVAQSCKDKNDIGTNILPTEDLLKTSISDTTSLETYILRDDSIITSSNTKLLIGKYLDPIFGESEASFAAEFTFKDYPRFQDTITVESIVLYLQLDTVNSKYYGDKTLPLELKVYELSKNINDTVIYSNYQVQPFVSNNLLGSGTHTGNGSYIEIPLNNSLGQRFVDNEDTLFQSTSNFYKYFKGIYVTAANSANAAIYRINTLNYASKIVLYYHYGYEAIKDTFEVSMTSSCARFNIFKHNYTGTNIETLLNNPNLKDSVCYIQSMAGLKTKIKFPYIKEWKKINNLAIQKAELIVKTVDPVYSSEDLYPALSPITMFGYTLENVIVLLSEFSGSTSYTGVKYKSNQYSLNITKQVQNMLDLDSLGYDLHIVSYLSSNDFSRSVIGSGTNSKAMKLAITYTIY